WLNGGRGVARCCWPGGASRCGLAAKTKVTVAWAVAKHPPPASPRPASVWSGWPVCAVVWSLCTYRGVPGALLLAHAPAASGPRSPPRPPPPPLRCPSAVPQAAGIAHHWPEDFPRYAHLADTTFSYVLTGRTTMLKSRLRHRCVKCHRPA
ncbi:hypothetical protein BS50DRAFT_667158, partial [Corynespora cassiicola Philippines]